MTQKVPPIHARMARDHLRLSQECLERAYELDPTLRKSTMPRQSSATARRHTFDEGAPNLSDLREAHGSLKEACDSLGEMLQAKKFSFAGARDHCKSAMDHAGKIHELLGGEDPGSDIDLVDPVAAANATEEKRDRLAEEARDGVGETPARSVVNLKEINGGEVDHRKDFNSIKQGGADAAMGYDYEALLQRDPDDPRYRGEVFAARYKNRNSKPAAARNAKKSPQHAQDTGTAARSDDYVPLDMNELFQVDR